MRYNPSDEIVFKVIIGIMLVIFAIAGLKMCAHSHGPLHGTIQTIPEYWYDNSHIVHERCECPFCEGEKKDTDKELLDQIRELLDENLKEESDIEGGE